MLTKLEECPAWGVFETYLTLAVVPVCHLHMLHACISGWCPISLSSSHNTSAKAQTSADRLRAKLMSGGWVSEKSQAHRVNG